MFFLPISFLPSTRTRFRWHQCKWRNLTNMVNTLRPRQNGRRFADDTFKRIFWNETVRISIKISLKFVPKGPIYNNLALVMIMAWRLSGDKPLSEPMMVSLLGLNELNNSHGVFGSQDIITTKQNKRCGYFDGLVQERRNSIADALELRLSCINSSIYKICCWQVEQNCVLFMTLVC